MTGRRIVVAIAALLGLSSVMMGAVADHVTGDADPAVATALRYHQLYAVVVLVLGCMPVHFNARLAAPFFILGTVFFCGGIYAAHLLGWGAFVYGAPAGGFLLMAGWLALAIAALRPA